MAGKVKVETPGTAACRLVIEETADNEIRRYMTVQPVTVAPTAPLESWL